MAQILCILSLGMRNGEHTSSTAGAATLTPRQRLRIAGITLLVELQHRIKRHVRVYFSMVRRRACCASFVKRSTSVNTTTAMREQNMLKMANLANPKGTIHIHGYKQQWQPYPSYSIPSESFPLFHNPEQIQGSQKSGLQDAMTGKLLI